MLTELLKKAENAPVYLSELRRTVDDLDESERSPVLLKLYDASSALTAVYRFQLPLDAGYHTDFLEKYICAELYNPLSCLGSCRADLLCDAAQPRIAALLQKAAEAFDAEKPRCERRSYGKCLNVNERFARSRTGKDLPFRLQVCAVPREELQEPEQPFSLQADAAAFHRARPDGLILGMDIGGNSIKCVLMRGDTILAEKRHGWTPFLYDRPSRMIGVIELLVRLFRKAAACIRSGTEADRTLLQELLGENDTGRLLEMLDAAEKEPLPPLTAIGIGFPDVVIDNRIVGGETYKTRAMRRSLGKAYEEDFRLLTGLRNVLAPYAEGGQVCIINDAAVAAFSALEEGTDSALLVNTVGTEIGTAFIRSDGSIPDVPMECYNFVLDIGSRKAAAYAPDDLRSIQNYNTGIAGTAQRLIGQGAFFRIAVDYFGKNDPDFLQKLMDDDVLRIENGLMTAVFDGQDRRSVLFGRIIDRAKTEKQPVFEEVGRALAELWRETERIAAVGRHRKVLIGGCLADRYVTDQLRAGLQKADPAADFEIPSESSGTHGAFLAAAGAVAFAGSCIC